MARPGYQLLCVSGYANPDEPGITVLKLDLETGHLEPFGAAHGINRPSYMAVHPDGRHMFTVSEVGDPAQGVTAWRFDPDSGELTANGAAGCGGKGNCYMAVDPTGQTLLMAHYASGSIAAARIHEDRTVSAQPETVIQHEGTGPNEKRQEGPHAHSINFDPADPTRVVAADLGADRLFLYRLDPAAARLIADGTAPPSSPGAGPRHTAFLPDEKRMLVIHELDGSVGNYKLGPDGSVELDQVISALSGNETKENHSADIHATPDGRFVYASNRGPNTIAAFRVENGRLHNVGWTDATGGHGNGEPRGFAIDPTGRFVVVGNQQGHRVVSFAINQDTGELSYTGHTAAAPRPTCVKFVPEPA